MFFYLKLAFLLSVISLMGYSGTSEQKKDVVQQSYVLSGDWKFNTFLGDGSNYRDISPTDKDIIIDNTDTDLVELNGDWKIGKEGARGSRQWGNSHVYHWSKNNDHSHNAKYYFPENLAAGYYEHFIYYPFGFGLHNTFAVKHSGGLTKHDINQRNRDGQWVSLGIYHIDAHKKHYVSAAPSSKSQVIIDAVMLRPIDEKAYLQAEKNKASAPLITVDDSTWYDLKVPGHWGMINKYSTYTGKGWYRKHFELPNDWQIKKNEKLRLHFEGVYHFATVYLNGEYVGSHQGGFTPFEIDITDAVNTKGNNILAVQADNSPMVGATWNWGGIIRDVSLVKTQDARVTYQYIHAEPDLKKGTAALTVKVRIENVSSDNRTFNFSGDISYAGEQAVLTNLHSQVEVAANSIKEFELTSALSKEQVKLWHFDRPNLYHLTSRISENDKVVHTKKDRFGIRKIELTETQMLLNGDPVRIGGYNRVSDHRYWGSSEPYELLAKDVELMKNAGANFMRIMHGTQNKKLIELCDEKGILLFEEINVRELNNPEIVAPDYLITKQWAKEMVERDINHPSIIGWSVGNELSHHYQYVETMVKYVKEELDPHRLVTNVSNTGYYKNDTAENDPLGLSDLMMQNIYQKDPEKVITTIAERWPNRPLFVSEYGLGRFENASLDNDYPNFNSWHEMLRGRNTHVVGTSIWSFNDYRSAYAQTLEEENRSWGIVNAWRQKRRGYATLQKGLSPVKDFELTQIDLNSSQAHVEFMVRGAKDYPSYRMQGYQLSWQLLDAKGEVLAEHHKDLPLLTPSSGRWSDTIHWSADVTKQVSQLAVKLLSTNGFTRYTYTHDFTVPKQAEIENLLTGVDDSGNQKVRVFIGDQKPGTQYFAKLTQQNGQIYKSKTTIDPYIELDLPNNAGDASVVLVAINGAGEGKPSRPARVKASKQLLPPVIWHSMIRDQKFILGFDGKIDDKSYRLRYGESADKLDKISTTSGRGMIVADLADGQKTVYYQLQRTTGKTNSSWTPVQTHSLLAK